MDRKVQISVKALVVGGLCVLFLFAIGWKFIRIDAALDNAKLTFTVQQDSGYLQQLVQYANGLEKRITELEKRR